MEPLAAGAGLALGLALFPAPALAHAPIPGVGAFWNGVVHPLLALPHLLFLLGFGALLGQNVPAGSRVGLALFAAALLPAVAFPGPSGPGLAALAGAALATGLFVALGRAHPAVVAVVALAGAVVVGLDSAPDVPAADAAFLSRVGVLLGALLVVILAGGLSAALRLPWQRIGVRVAGSWLSATSILVLAFDMAGGSPE